MSQIGKPTEKITVTPKELPVPPKTAPAPLPEPVEQPVETPT